MEPLTTEQAAALVRFAREADAMETKGFDADDLSMEARGRGRIEGARAVLAIILGVDEAHAALILDGDE